MITFAQISDLHVDLGERAAQRVRRLVSALDPMRALDAVLITGDIADNGTPEQYAQVSQLLSGLRVPVLALPGNHDVRRAFGPGLLGLPAEDTEINRSVPVGPVDFLLCDSVLPGRSEGRLSDATLAWLTAELARRERTRTALLAFHHPPTTLYLPALDPTRQSGADRLAELLTRHPEVVALFSGHVHAGAVTSFAGRPLVCAPGCVSTVRPPVEAAGVADPDAPPGYAVHVLDDQARLVTFFRSVSGG